MGNQRSKHVIKMRPASTKVIPVNHDMVFLRHVNDMITHIQTEKDLTSVYQQAKASGNNVSQTLVLDLLLSVSTEQAVLITNNHPEEFKNTVMDFVKSRVTPNVEQNPIRDFENFPTTNLAQVLPATQRLIQQLMKLLPHVDDLLMNGPQYADTITKMLDDIHDKKAELECSFKIVLSEPLIHPLKFTGTRIRRCPPAEIAIINLLLSSYFEEKLFLQSQSKQFAICLSEFLKSYIDPDMEIDETRDFIPLTEALAAEIQTRILALKTQIPSNRLLLTPRTLSKIRSSVGLSLFYTILTILKLVYDFIKMLPSCQSNLLVAIADNDDPEHGVATKVFKDICKDDDAYSKKFQALLWVLAIQSILFNHYSFERLLGKAFPCIKNQTKCKVIAWIIMIVVTLPILILLIVSFADASDSRSSLEDHFSDDALTLMMGQLKTPDLIGFLVSVVVDILLSLSSGLLYEDLIKLVFRQ